jgi:hypothetical protein
MEALWLALQESGFAQLVRNAEFLYPAANVIHILGVIGFFAVVAAMDFAILGVLRGEPAKAVVARLRPWAAALFAAIVAAGFILFIADAVALSQNIAFRLKLAALVLALANVALNGWALARKGEPSRTFRATALASLLLWLGIAALGRYIAYI